MPLTTEPGDLYDRLARTRQTPRIGGLNALDTDVATPHGAAVIATDESGRKHLLVPVADDLEARPDLGATVSIRLRTLMDRDTRRRFVDVGCTDQRLDDLFDIVAAEMLEGVKDEPDANHFRTCQRVLDRWRQLLRRGTTRLLSIEQLVGLFGELWWLRRIGTFDPDRALGSWVGPTGAPQDFGGADLVLEVKTLTTGTHVQIHGMSQLEVPPGRDLLLAAVHLAPATDQDSRSVPRLVDELSEIGINTVDLLSLLAEVGYDHTDRDAYEANVWKVVGEEVRLVGSTFPRLTPSTTVHGTDGAIKGVSYTLNLAACPKPVDYDLTDLARKLAGG